MNISGLLVDWLKNTNLIEQRGNYMYHVFTDKNNEKKITFRKNDLGSVILYYEKKQKSNGYISNFIKKDYLHFTSLQHAQSFIKKKFNLIALVINVEDLTNANP